MYRYSAGYSRRERRKKERECICIYTSARARTAHISSINPESSRTPRLEHTIYNRPALSPFIVTASPPLSSPLVLLVPSRYLLFRVSFSTDVTTAFPLLSSSSPSPLSFLSRSLENVLPFTRSSFLVTRAPTPVRHTRDTWWIRDTHRLQTEWMQKSIETNVVCSKTPSVLRLWCNNEFFFFVFFPTLFCCISLFSFCLFFSFFLHPVFFMLRA